MEPKPGGVYPILCAHLTSCGMTLKVLKYLAISIDKPILCNLIYGNFTQVVNYMILSHKNYDILRLVIIRLLLFSTKFSLHFCDQNVQAIY